MRLIELQRADTELQTFQINIVGRPFVCCILIVVACDKTTRNSRNENSAKRYFNFFIIM